MNNTNGVYIPNKDVKPKDMIRLETGDILSNGQFARVVSVESWGVVCETNWQRPNDPDYFPGKTYLYRAAWHEFFPADQTDLTSPDMLTIRKSPLPFVSGGTRPVQGVMKVGHTSPTGNPCPNCGGVNLVRDGSCVKCIDCFYNEGCGG